MRHSPEPTPPRRSLTHRRAHRLTTPTAALLLLTALPALCGPEPSFSGHWYLDLRTPQQREAKAECGGTGFDLVQQGNGITGTHYFATADCGRVNEGGEVKGVAAGSEAILHVTSGRNGAVTRGRATLQGDRLEWQAENELEAAVPEGDASLILGKGVLERLPGSDAK